MSTKRVRSDGRVLKRRMTGETAGPEGTGRSLESSPRRVRSSKPADRKKKVVAQMQSAEETLGAIQSGEVDALIVSGRGGPRLVTLAGGEPAYRLLVEAMSEGAATLSWDGAVIYCNRNFAKLIRRPPGRVLGIAVQSLLAKTERDRFEALLAEARKGIAKGEFNLRSGDGSLVPVYFSLNRFQGYEGLALGMVITDLREQKRKQAEEIKQAETMRRLLLERVLSAQEEERRRVARELHDETGQLLTSLLVGLRTLEHSQNLAQAKALGDSLRGITARTIDEVGRLARGLHPMVLDDHGLGVALSRYVEEFIATYKIDVDLRMETLDPILLPLEVQTGLYRVLQEALTNVARHSGARRAKILFAQSSTALEVTVMDDGCGFDAAAVAVSSRRLGIQSMRERAAILGGTVSFTSSDKGTRILVQIPLHTQDLQSSVEPASI